MRRLLLTLLLLGSYLAHAGELPETDWLELMPKSDHKALEAMPEIDHTSPEATGTFTERTVLAERVMDSNDQEKERGITILAKNTAITWQGNRINIVDTPGHADFGGEVERVLSMVDSVLILVDAMDGPMPQTRFVTQKAFAMGFKPIVVINKVDRPGARPDWVLNQTFDLFDRLGATDEQLDFTTVYASGLNGYAGMDESVRSGDMTPLFQTIVDKVAPPPVDMEGPFQMRITSLDYNNYVGIIGVGRVQRGTIRTNQQVTVVARDGKVRNAKVLQVLGFMGLERHEVKEARAGDIIALAGLKSVTTGDTLCDPDHPVILEKMDFPDPVIELAIEPKSKADQEKLGQALGRLVQEDPTFRVSTDQETGQTVIKGMGELHLEIKVDILRRTYKVEANIGAPQVAYRESLGRKVDIDYTHKKQTGGTGQFARVMITFEPGEPGSGFVFESAIVGGAVPKEYIPGVEKGLESAKENGLLAGFPLIDFKATLTDGKFHDVDSSVLAFEIAARAAFRELKEKGSPKLLEPIMAVEVVTPEDYLGSVIGDLNGRRGMIQGQDMRGNATVVNAFVPLANMFGYVNTLRGMSQGRAQFTMQYDHYEPVPQHVADEVIKKYSA